MATFEIKMPKLGESITEGTIISWSVKVGDTVEEDDVLFEVSTAKVSAEIPSPVEGKVKQLLFNEGDTVAVGTVVAILEIEGEGEDNGVQPETSEATQPKEQVPSRPRGIIKEFPRGRSLVFSRRIAISESCRCIAR